MTIYIRTYKDGRKSYGTGLVHNSINNNLPVKEEKVDLDDELVWEFLNNPTAYELTITDGKGKITPK